MYQCINVSIYQCINISILYLHCAAEPTPIGPLFSVGLLLAARPLPLLRRTKVHPAGTASCCRARGLIIPSSSIQAGPVLVLLPWQVNHTQSPLRGDCRSPRRLIVRTGYIGPLHNRGQPTNWRVLFFSVRLRSSPQDHGIIAKGERMGDSNRHHRGGEHTPEGPLVFSVPTSLQEYVSRSVFR